MENEVWIPVGQVCTNYHIEVSFVDALAENGLVNMIIVEGTPCIGQGQLRDLEKMIRLHYDLDINLEGLDAIAHLLRQMDSLQEELLLLKNRLKLYENDAPQISQASAD